MKQSILLILILQLASCALCRKDETNFKTRSQWIMGTDILVSLAEKDTHYFPQVFAVFKEVDKKLSTYKPQSEISRLNRKRKLKVSGLTFEAIQFSLNMYKKTQGFFDPSLGKLTIKAYGFGRQGAKEPTEKELQEALKEVGGQNIQLLPNNQVSLSQNIELDFGGIGKGYSVDLASKKLKELGVSKGKVAASGDIRCLSPCDIQIVDPFTPDQTMALMKGLPQGTAISTSGTYERFIYNQKVHHLLDPKTGKPAQGFVSITLVGTASNAELDAWATALSVMPVKMALQVIEKSDNFGGLFVLPDHQIIQSQKFAKFVNNLEM